MTAHIVYKDGEVKEWSHIDEYFKLQPEECSTDRFSDILLVAQLYKGTLTWHDIIDLWEEYKEDQTALAEAEDDARKDYKEGVL